MDFSLLLNRLVSREGLDPESVERVLELPEHRGKPAEQVLLDEGLVDEVTLLKHMADVYALPYKLLTPELLDHKMASSIPRPVMENFLIYPLLIPVGEREVAIATADPFDVLAADTIRQITGREMRPILATRQDIKLAIKGRLLGREGIELLVEQVPEDQSLDYVQSLLASNDNYQSELDTPIIMLVNAILAEAVRLKASDIHIEPQEKTVRIRYRLDGLLKTVAELPKRVERACISRTKLISGLDISESRRPQDGRTSVRSATASVDMRVSTVPTFYGEKVVLRLLDQGTTTVDLERLGLGSDDEEMLRGFLRSSHGMILITGPTGSGKTSTLYAALRLLNEPTTNIMTVEDPVEYQVAGISQVQVNVRAGVTFANTLRSFLRQDPDIIMVGEIRDLETAEIAVQAAQTGHLVFSTLHTNEAPSTLSRLIMMGLEPHMVAGALLLVMAQRLVRRLCSHCRKPATLSPEQKRLLSVSVERALPSRLFHASGCPECQEVGYKGRLGLFELLPMTARVRQQILLDPAEESIWQAARADGLRTLLEDGIAKVEKGLTSLDEVLRVVTIKRAQREADEGADPAGARAGERSTLETQGAGGERARRTTTVREAMTSKLFTLHPDTELEAIAEQFLEQSVTGAPVVSPGGELLGVVSTSDLLAFGRNGGVEGEDGAVKPTLTARDIMSKSLITIEPDSTVKDALKLFWRHKVHRLLVLDEGRLVGVVTPLDLVTRAEIH